MADAPLLAPESHGPPWHEAAEAVEAALDAYAEDHDGGTSYGAAAAVLTALRAAPPEVVAAALGWERTGCDVCGPDAYRPPAADEGTTE